MAAFTLAHLSDPHLPPLPTPLLSDLAGKRAFGYLHWIHSRHKYHLRSVLDQLVSDLQAQVPDHIAISGDLVNLALEAEFAPALAWLQSVGAADRVTVIPGNHDTYVRITRHRFAEAFADYVGSDAPPDSGHLFPLVRRRGPLVLIGVSSAVPTPALMATGRLGPCQLEALDRLLAGLSAEPAFRVLLVHHPLRSNARAKRLTDAFELLALLRRHGVELVLHGHDHVHSTIWIDGPKGSIPAIGVPSASALAHGRYPAAAYNLFTIRRDGAAWRCAQTVRGIDDGSHIRQLRTTQLL
ncbi:MAG TPA: metallophosphoesterase [Steroidobacteraceae bacterium]